MTIIMLLIKTWKERKIYFDQL